MFTTSGGVNSDLGAHSSDKPEGRRGCWSETRGYFERGSLGFDRGTQSTHRNLSRELLGKLMLFSRNISLVGSKEKPKRKECAWSRADSSVLGLRQVKTLGQIVAIQHSHMALSCVKECPPFLAFSNLDQS